MSLAGQISLLAARIAAEVKANTAGLALKAPLASPALSGNPTAPTATAGNSSPSIATTAFVAAGLALKANLDSPTFTGTPKAPTPAVMDNSPAIATTAFVNSAATSQYGGQTAGGTPYFQRIATINGNGASAGANVSLLVSGLGDYGSARRGIHFVQLAQRGSGASSYQLYLRTIQNGAGGVLAFYAKNTGTYTFELWIKTANWQNDWHVNVLDTGGATVAQMKMDSASTTDPGGLLAATDIIDFETVGGDVSSGGRLASISLDISNQDLNQNLNTGFYRGSNMSNNPVGDNGWAWVLNQAHDTGSWRGQVAQGYTGGSSGRLFWRNQANGTWGGWSEAAKIDSPAFKNSPTAPTQGTGANDTTIATTAFVKNQGYSTTTDAQNRANTAQNNAESYANSTFVNLTGDTMSGTLSVNGRVAMNDLGWANQGYLNSSAIQNRTDTVASTSAGTGGSSSTSIVTMNTNGTLAHLGGYLQMPDSYSTTVTTRGPLYVSAAGHIGYNSSLRANKDLHGEVTMDDAMLNKWVALPVYRFHYRDHIALEEEAHIEQVGMVAEDMEAAGDFELLLQREEDKDADGFGDLAGIDYGKIAMYEHIAIRRLLERIESLEKEISNR